MFALLKSFRADESGATAVEYGLIAAIVGIGLVTGLTTLKTDLSNTFNKVGKELAKY